MEQQASRVEGFMPQMMSYMTPRAFREKKKKKRSHEQLNQIVIIDLICYVTNCLDLSYVICADTH